MHLYIHYLYDQRSCRCDTTADRIGCKSPGLKLLVELHNSLNTLAEDIEIKVLVWRVDGIALKAKAHEDCLHAKNLLKVTDNGDAASTAHCKRFLAKSLLKTGLGSLVRRESNWAHIALTAVHGGYLNLYAIGGKGAEIINEHL